MENKYIGVIIGLAVAVIVIGSLLAPVVSDTVATSDTYKNDGYYNLGFSETNIPTLSWNADSPYIIHIGDTEQVDMSDLPVGLYTILSSPSTVIRYYINSNNTVALQSYTTESPGFFSVNSNNSGAYLVLTSNDNIITAEYKNDGDVTTKVYPESTSGYYYINTSGDFVMKKSNESCYLSEDSNITLAGITFRPNVTTQRDIGIFATGTYNNLNFSYFYGVVTSPTVSDVIPDYEQINGHIGFISLREITFTLTAGGDEPTEQIVVYNYFIVPAEVTVARTDPLDSSAAGIVQIVPIVVIVSLIAAAIAFFMRSRF